MTNAKEVQRHSDALEHHMKSEGKIWVLLSNKVF